MSFLGEEHSVVDYPALIATAQRLITENGRSVTFVEFDTTLDDSDKPWRGPADPRATPESTLTVDAVFVEPLSVEQLGSSTRIKDLLARSDKIMIVSPGANVDLTIFQEVVDGSESWKIQGVETLQPGSEIILNYVGVSR